MSLPTVTLKSKQKVCDVTVQRIAFYQQCQVVEALDEESKHYYMFFHKEHYLNYVSASKLPDRSFVKSAFNEGITFHGIHPLVTSLLTASTYKKKDFNTLFTKLKQQWGHPETAQIATYFTPFIKKTKLAHFIQSLFYEERRSGKMLSCYRIYSVLEDFAPNHPLIDAFSGDLKFVEIEKRYKLQDESTLATDTLYTENEWYKNRLSSYDDLHSLYEKQSRLIEQRALSIDHAAHTQTEEDYQTLLDSSPSLLSPPFFTDLYARELTHHSFLNDYLDSLLAENQLKEAAELINKHKLALSSIQSQTFIHLAERNQTDSPSPDSWRELTLSNLKTEQSTKLLELAVRSILHNNDISYVREWLQPFEDVPEAQVIVEKVIEMDTLSDDPGKQRRLGELYYEFQQPNLAIDCMSWDMELDSANPEPVQWLAKLYNEVGNKEEHDAYQQLYVSMMQQR
ncbi:tetratricopeptide repeat protein [Halobacillus salinus]|uniref:Uncharacterized protein n=1 Tax=Halobacillus salinus TaxID=192814 RepID=A0A4Z0GZ52_9BACI|nr:hypothetical protein [Halobacillus salinus]TGB01964.1 hypothetical protein E4663_15140 [Halobacillus salinus]